MTCNKTEVFYLNVGHFYTHYFMMIFTTSAALGISSEFGLEYGEILNYSIPGLFAYGVLMVPAGYLADKWDKKKMMTIFFLGIGVSSLLTAMATTPVQLCVGLFFIGVFGSIYHPTGLPMIIGSSPKTGLVLAVNGIYGNMGVAVSALITGYIIGYLDWHYSFFLPGIIAVLTGGFYFFSSDSTHNSSKGMERTSSDRIMPERQEVLSTAAVDFRSILFLFVTSSIGGLLFISLTYAMPKILIERIEIISTDAAEVGGIVFIIFTVAAFTQLVTGYLLDRHTVKYVFTGIVLAQSFFLFLMRDLQGFPAFLVLIILMMLIFGQIPLNDVYISQIVSKEWQGRAFAARNAIYSVVAPLSIYFLTYVLEVWNFSMLFIILGFLTFLTVINGLFLPSRSFR